MGSKQDLATVRLWTVNVLSVAVLVISSPLYFFVVYDETRDARRRVLANAAERRRKKAKQPYGEPSVRHENRPNFTY